MATTQVTPELIKLIKELRKATNTTSKDIAEHIQKSTGFISNVETGKTTNIDCSCIFKIFDYFIEKDESITSKINAFLDSGLKVNFSEAEKKENEEQKRFYIQFDKQYRTIYIENSLIEYIKEELNTLGIKPVDVIKEMNANKSIPDHEKYTPNTLLIEFWEQGMSEMIVFKVEENLLDRIIEGKIRKTKYIFLLGILYALELIKGCDFEEAYENANQILYNNKTYTLDERHALMQKEEISGIKSDIIRIDKSKTMLPDNLINYYEAVSNLVEILEIIKERDIEYVTDKVSVLANNLKNYRLTSMTLAIMGLQLEAFGKFKPKEQIEVFKSIKRLIDEKISEKESLGEELDIVKFDDK